MKGVGRLYSAFRHEVRKERTKIAPLQALGRLEEYLTKEFASVVHRKSRGAVLALTNLVRRNEQKIDIALLDGDLSTGAFEDKSFKRGAIIRAFLEAKYLRNLHRIGPGDAGDETRTTLLDLRRQLRQFDKSEHAGYKVSLRGKRKDIYGLVLASYVRSEEQPDRRKEFIRGIVTCGAEIGFCYQDLPRPYVTPIYTDIPVMLLKRKYRVSLYSGLWRSRS